MVKFNKIFALTFRVLFFERGGKKISDENYMCSLSAGRRCSARNLNENFP